MQAYLNIGSPCAGTMFQASTWHGQHAFAVPPRGASAWSARSPSGWPGPAARDAPYELADMPAAVAASMAAIEVVQDRYVDYPSLDTPTLIADDFFHYACVLGPQSESMRPESLREVTASMAINGLQVGRGIGTDILGEPLQVLCWLANNAAAWGTPLLAGDVVLLGSLVQTQWVQAGNVVTVTNDPLGGVPPNSRSDRPAPLSRRCSAGCPDADNPTPRRCQPAHQASRQASARAAGCGPN